MWLCLWKGRKPCLYCFLSRLSANRSWASFTQTDLVSMSLWKSLRCWTMSGHLGGFHTVVIAKGARANLFFSFWRPQWISSRRITQAKGKFDKHCQIAYQLTNLLLSAAEGFFHLVCCLWQGFLFKKKKRPRQSLNSLRGWELSWIPSSCLYLPSTRIIAHANKLTFSLIRH